MIAMGSTTAIRPLTLQSPTGTYGSVPAPSGSTLSAPRFITKQPTLSAPPATGSIMPVPAPTSPATAGSTAQATGVAPPRSGLAPPSSVSPSTGGVTPAQTPPAVLNAAPAPAAPAPAADVPRGTVPAGTTAVSGDAVPYNIGTGASGQTSSMLSRLATEAGRQLDQPTVWDDPLAQQIKDAQTAGINNDYNVAGQHLDASLADRGINYSTIAGGDIMDLEKQRAGALSSVDADIAAQRANALAAGRTSAFNNANSVLGASSAADQTARNNQVGERDYTDQLRNKAQADALTTTELGQTYGRQNDQDFQSLLDQVYGYGNGGQTGAAGIYGSQGGQQLASQATDQQGLAQLAQLAARFFGTNPGTGTGQ